MRAVYPNANAFPTWAESVALADLWTITLTDGTLLRWTGADVPITAFGQTFQTGPLIARGNTRLTSTLEVDTLDVTFQTSGASGGVTLGGVPLAHAAANGALDGAAVKLERAFMPAWGTVAATVHLFEGRVADVEPKHTEVALRVKSLLDVLDADWPRNLYQATCNHRLYGAGCGVSRAAHQVAATATGGGSTTAVAWTTGKPAGYYDQGVIAFTSGPNAGARRTIKTSDVAGVTVSLPFAYPVQVGDRFTVVPGCSKTVTRAPGDPRPSCTEYDNRDNFRGFPWVPKPEMAR